MRMDLVENPLVQGFKLVDLFVTRLFQHQQNNDQNQNRALGLGLVPGGGGSSIDSPDVSS